MPRETVPDDHIRLQKQPERGTSLYFTYGEKEISYLKSKDKKLAEVIDRVGYLEREMETDLFSAVVHNIVGQQISMAAQETIWKRLLGLLSEVNADTILAISREELQSIGVSFRKADYILDFAGKVKSGEFDIDALHEMEDEDVIKALTSLKGIGVWTAEMIMIFCMGRTDVVSYGDLGVQRGMRMLYRHRNIDKEKFRKYCKRYSPYGTVASFYLWAVSGGAIPELTDPSVKKK